MNNPKIYITFNNIHWEVEMTHGFEFSIVPWQYGDTGDLETDFCMAGTGIGNSHQPQDHPHNGRGDIVYGSFQHNVPMSVTIRFIGWYGSDPNNQKMIFKEKVIYQDEIDEVRQEYVDHDIPVPSRTSFREDQSAYNDGCGGPFVDAGLLGYETAWAAACDAIIKEKDPNKSITINDLSVSSAYRNPEHNRHHIVNPPGAPRSRHQYGDALDVLYVDLNNDGHATKDGDAELMEKAAYNASATKVFWKTYSTHVHAD